MRGRESVGSCVQVVGAPHGSDALRSDPIWARLESFACAHDFSHWTYSAEPISARPADLATTVTTYPVHHTEQFFKRGLDRTNPGRSYARVGREPRMYTAIREDASPPNPAVAAQLALNRAYDVTRGVLIPLHGTLGTRARLGLSFRGTEGELDAIFPHVKKALVVFAEELHLEIQREHQPRFVGHLLPRLTPRQRQVVRLFAEGCTNSEVAERLSLSIHTVDKHVARIKALLGASSLAQVTALAFRWGLLD